MPMFRMGCLFVAPLNLDAHAACTTGSVNINIIIIIFIFILKANQDNSLM
ncbi:hypothetical protein Hanom_Chr11g01010401 [Helianthus anomalus]